MADGQVGKGIEALLIGHDLIGRLLCRVDQFERGPATTAPLGSATVPEMLPPVAARNEEAEKIRIAAVRIEGAGFEQNTCTSIR